MHEVEHLYDVKNFLFINKNLAENHDSESSNFNSLNFLFLFTFKNAFEELTMGKAQKSELSFTTNLYCLTLRFSEANTFLRLDSKRSVTWLKDFMSFYKRHMMDKSIYLQAGVLCLSAEVVLNHWVEIVISTLISIQIKVSDLNECNQI